MIDFSSGFITSTSTRANTPIIQPARLDPMITHCSAVIKTHFHKYVYFAVAHIIYH